MERFTIYEKIEIVMESFKSNNIAELCRRYKGAVSNLYKWEINLYEIGEKSSMNQKETIIMKRLVGDPALVIDELKKITERRNNGIYK